MSLEWETQSNLNVRKLKYDTLRKLENNYVQLWKNKKNEDVSRLVFYNDITKKFRLELYLIDSENFDPRRALCRPRISAHDLQIERGGYSNMPKEDRKCTTCGVIEDELHFLDNCIKFENWRSRLIKVYTKRIIQTQYVGLKTLYSNQATPVCRMTGRCCSQNMCMTYTCLHV